MAGESSSSTGMTRTWTKRRKRMQQMTKSDWKANRKEQIHPMNLNMSTRHLKHA